MIYRVSGTMRPFMGGENCDKWRLCVCLSASITPELGAGRLFVRVTHVIWPWLGPPLTAVRYVMYFRYYG